jgi:hypothetical protein
VRKNIPIAEIEAYIGNEREWARMKHFKASGKKATWYEGIMFELDNMRSALIDIPARTHKDSPRAAE